jgi:general secretion pathway protein C
MDDVTSTILNRLPLSMRKKPPLSQIFATAIVTILLIALGLQLAWWGWHFLMPAPNIIALDPSAGVVLEDIALSRRLFGGGEAAQATEAAASDIRLKGVFAVDGVTLSAAVVNWAGKDQAVRVGQELMKGATLAEVHADYIIVARNGARERIDLDKFRVASATANSTAKGAASGGAFRLNVTASGGGYSLSRQELNGVLQDPRQMEFLGALGVAPGGGVRIDGAGANTLAGKLGLQSGDIISTINGQPVNSAGDLARFYSQFATLSALRLEVKRSGSPTVLNYTIQN